MMSAKSVRGSKRFDGKPMALTVIVLVLISHAKSLCAAGGHGGIDSFSGWTAAADTELDELRGGFMLDNGMVVDLSFATSVLINGQEQFSDRFVLASDFSIDQLRGAVVNNGPNNFVMSDAAMNNMTIIQNTLDNQLITMMRSIDITISNVKNMTGLGSSSFGFAP